MTITAVPHAGSEAMIPGVYNYCDDWCDYCPVTARCRAYHMRQSIEVPASTARGGGGPDPDENVTPQMVAFTRSVARADGLTTPGLDAALAGDPDEEYGLAPSDEPLSRHAMAYAIAAEMLVHKAGWRTPKTPEPGVAPPPLDVVVWFHLFLAVKTRRALVAVHRAERGRPGEMDDARGSAKIALISIDRSRGALLDAARGPVRVLATQLVVMLDLLRDGLEARVPGARQFVRAGLDGPVERSGAPSA